jgi:uncharacterized coiled-coil protein SlyX
VDVEKTIDFLLKNQARMDARFEAKFAKADERLTRLERIVATNNRVVTRLTRYGVSLRSDVRRHDRAIREIDERLARVAEAQAKSATKMVEIEEKLDGLIDIIDKSIHRNGQ